MYMYMGVCLEYERKPLSNFNANFSSVAPSVRSYMSVERNLIKCLNIVHGFRPERASQGEQNGTNFSSTAPSSEE